MSDQRIKSEKNDNQIKRDPMESESQEDDDNNSFDGRGNLDTEAENSYDDKKKITDKDSWKVIDAYFNQHGLVSQQLGSFNQFVEKNIQEIIDENKTIVIKP